MGTSSSGIRAEAVADGPGARAVTPRAPRFGLDARWYDRLHLGGALAVGQVVGRGALALALLALVRTLSPADFSTLVLALALASILGTIADAGFARLLVRDTARAETSHASLVRQLIRVRMLAVMATAALAAVALTTTPNPFTIGFGALGVTYLALEAIALGYENAAAGAQRPWRFVFAQSVAALVMLGGLAALIADDAITLTSAMAVLTTASATKVLGHLYAWRRQAGTPEPTAARISTSSLYRQALPFLGLTLISTLYYKAGIVALYGLRGAAESAPYAAALRIVDATALIAGVVFLAASPTLSRMHRDRPDLLWPTWRKMVTVVACAVLPFAVAVGVAAQPICALLFGEPYRDSASTALRLMLPGVAFMVLQAVSAAVVFMGDHHRDALLLGAFSLAVCVVSAVGLSAAFGSSGTAVSLTLSELMSFASFAWLIRLRYSGAAVTGAPG